MKFKVSEDFYKSVFENTLSGIAYCEMIFDEKTNPVDFKYVWVNKNFEKLAGLKNVLGKKATQLIPGIKKSNPELLEIYGRISLGGKPEVFETYLQQLSRWFLISAYSTKKKFFVSIFLDITEQKETLKNLNDSQLAARNVLEDLEVEKEKLVASSAKDEAMLASVGDGMVAIDLDTKIMFMNDVAKSMLYCEDYEVIGKPYTDFFSAVTEDGKPVPDTLLTAQEDFKSGAIIHNDSFFYLPVKGGKKFQVSLTIAPIKQENKILGIIDVFRDITREKEIDKAKTEFVSLASHQLRTPLTAVSWYSEMILNGDAGIITPVQKRYLEAINHGNKRMIDLVNTLLNVSRIELGTFLVEATPINIVERVNIVLDDLKIKIADKKLKIIFNIDKSISTLMFDPKLIDMIVQNLIANAVTYTPSGGKIELAISIDKTKHLLMKVSDTGYGIPRNQQNKIFTKFFRADNAREKDTDGTGLGLYIVKSIVEKSGGKIWFESAENKGSTFYVSLPLDVKVSK